MIELTPSDAMPSPIPRPWVFVAGSIEQGSAPNWQEEVRIALADKGGSLFNPRRRDWDASWSQTKDDDRFRGQVEWELEWLEKADLIAMYFSPDTKAPISLLELGLFARSGRLLVACPEGYWRRGNVVITAERYGAKMVPDLGALIAALRRSTDSLAT